MRRILPVARMMAGLLLSGVFIYAGILKIADQAVFRKALENYHLIPSDFLPVFVHWIPWMEVCLGGFFWIPGFRRACLSGLILLLLTFSAALLQSVWRGLDIDCGCFGSRSFDADLHWVILRNLLLILTALWLIKNSPAKTAV
jgi:putative oxidoreductase